MKRKWRKQNGTHEKWNKMYGTLTERTGNEIKCKKIETECVEI